MDWNPEITKNKILARPRLIKDGSMRKVIGITTPGNKVRIYYDNTDEYDEGYIFTTPECRWDEGDVFIHINNMYDSDIEEWKHLYELVDNVSVVKIEVIDIKTI